MATSKQPVNLTSAEVAEKAGVSLEQAKRLWRALGFPEIGDDQAFFDEADVLGAAVPRPSVASRWPCAGAEAATHIRTAAGARCVSFILRLR